MIGTEGEGEKKIRSIDREHVPWVSKGEGKCMEGRRFIIIFARYGILINLRGMPGRVGMPLEVKMGVIIQLRLAP